MLACRKYARIMQKLDFPARLTDSKIQNVVGSCGCGFPLRLEGLAHSHTQFTSYEPELFPGLIYRMNEPKMVILAFVSGKIVITGAKSMDRVREGFLKMWPLFVQFRKDETKKEEENANGYGHSYDNQDRYDQDG